MLRRRKSPKFGIRKSERIRSAGHLAHVRGFVCCAYGRNGHACWGKTEAHHVRLGTDGCLSEKPSDNFAIPACSGLHRQIHDQGEEAVEKQYAINLLSIAEQLWRASPHRRKAETLE